MDGGCGKACGGARWGDVIMARNGNRVASYFYQKLAFTSSSSRIIGAYVDQPDAALVCASTLEY